MNNYGNQFNSAPQQQQMPQQGFYPPTQYRAPKPPKSPGERGKGYYIPMVALGGVVVLFGLFKLFNSFYYASKSSDYHIAYFGSSLIYIALGAALIFIMIEKLIAPNNGDKINLKMAFSISGISLAGLTALFGLMNLFDDFSELGSSLKYTSNVRVEFIFSYFSESIFILASCAVLILFFVFRLIDVLKVKKSMQGFYPANPAQFGQPQQAGAPVSFQQFSAPVPTQQFSAPNQPQQFSQPNNNNSKSM